jgi:CRP/FNR family cyclic AMP-dependent transcriptional regulator
MSSSILEALAATPLLAGLHPEALALLEQEGISHAFAAGEVIVREGEEGHAFFVLLEGDVEIIKHAGQPHPVVLARLHSHTFFGEMCIVEPMTRAATVRAVTQVAALEIKAATLHHLFRKMPDQYAIVLLNLARDLARRLRALDDAFAG